MKRPSTTCKGPPQFIKPCLRQLLSSEIFGNATVAWLDTDCPPTWFCKVTVPTAWGPSVSLGPRGETPTEKYFFLSVFCSSTCSDRFWKLCLGTSMKDGEMMSLNACKTNINVLNWETSRCEMNGKMRECGIVLPGVRGWDIHLGAKFRDIFRYREGSLCLHLCLCPCSCLPVPLPARGYLGLGSEWSHL